MTSLGINERFINVDEACEYLSIKKSWLYQNRKLKQIPYYKISRKLVFRVQELDDWMTANGWNSAH